MEEFDDDSGPIALKYEADSIPEALGMAVKSVLTSLETNDHEYEHGDEVGELVAEGYKIVIYINRDSSTLN